MNHDHCIQCPRQCGAARADGAIGYCGVPWEFLVSRVSLHLWEEPAISGRKGSGTIFFSGCNLRCVFCQNREISHTAKGKPVSAERLAELMLELEARGAHNINLVTPTPYARQLAEVLRAVKPRLGIPVVYNCGGYESVETLKELEGLVDIYLPDCKYFDPALSKRLSGAKDYFEVAAAALAEMLRQTGKPRLSESGLLTRGTVVRHLVLPGHRADSIALLRALSERFGTDAFLLSLMSQYTPEFLDSACTEPSLGRRVTSFEYERVRDEALRLGFDGYLQSRSSASAAFTPDFSEETL